MGGEAVQVVGVARGDDGASPQVGVSDQKGIDCYLLGMSRQSAWEYYAARTRADLAANVAANTDLSEDDAMDLAVEEVRAVRRPRRAG